MITTRELGSVVRALGKAPSEAELAAIVKVTVRFDLRLRASCSVLWPHH